LNKPIKKIAVLTSGCDAPGMNAAIRSVVRSCAHYSINCVGINRGYSGLIAGDFTPLSARSVKNLIGKGGTMLKSSHCDDFKTISGREKAFEQLKKEAIDGLIIIGGDGTLKGGLDFFEQFNFPVNAIPATIDNNVAGTDKTIGFDSALNTVIDAIDKIRDTANAHNRIFFIEVMGEDAGFIALNAGIGGGAEEILIPETNTSVTELVKSLKKSKDKGNNSSIVVVAEGDKTGSNVFELAKEVNKIFPEDDMKVSVLGHIQRGGAPSCYDRVLASRMGLAAVEAMLDKQKGIMVGIQNNKMVRVSIKDAVKSKNLIDKELLKVAEISSF
jgi:6-phosphofructokinase 1